MIQRQVCYGSGLQYCTTEASASVKSAVEDFPLDNNIALADAEAVNPLTYKRVEIKSVQGSYIFSICKWLIHCVLIHYKPHLPKRQQCLNTKLLIISRLSKQYHNFNILDHTPHRTNSAKIGIFHILQLFTSIS